VALLLAEADVARVLTVHDLVPLMRETLAAFARGEARQPVRSNMTIRPANGFYGTMPAHVPALHAFGLKSVTFFPANEGTALPTHLAVIVLHDDRTGVPLALVDGRLITALRTAAVSAVSVELLARADARRLAILGSGVQARSHLEALLRIRPFEQVRVWSRTAANAGRFVREMARTGATLAAAPTAREAVADADVIVTVTSATEPILEGAWLRPGTHLCVVGSSHPRMREVDAAAVARSRVFVDSREAAAIEAGDLLLAAREGRYDLARIAGELGDVAAGAPGRASADEVTLFKSLGLGVEDVASAALALARARAAGLGTPVAL
jgi:ornithine cyclodeaminase